MTAPFPGLTVLGSALRRQRYQLGGALLLAMLVPSVVRYAPDGLDGFANGTYSFVMLFAAVVSSHFIIRQFSSYPGESALTTALPGATIGFGVSAAWIVMNHLPYSRGLLIWGYAATIVWYAAIGFIRSRYFRQKLAVVPVGQVAGLAALPLAEWMPLSAPVPMRSTGPVQGVVADLAADFSPAWRNYLITCATSGIPVYDSVRTKEMITGQVDLGTLANIGFETLLPNRVYQSIKSVADMLCAWLALPLVLPVIGIASLLIRLDSSGPAIFVQKRVGYRGRSFDCYKLRSMYSSSGGQGPSFTSDGDPRITRIGRFIRKYRIDELPQIFNIIKGDMSWIGPRPEAEALARAYEDNIPFYAFRHAVKPGITGWAAIRQGNVAEIDAATIKLRYDFFYIKNLSPSLDALIAAKTVWIMLTGKGSR